MAAQAGSQFWVRLCHGHDIQDMHIPRIHGVLQTSLKNRVSIKVAVSAG